MTNKGNAGDEEMCLDLPVRWLYLDAAGELLILRSPTEATR